MVSDLDRRSLNPSCLKWYSNGVSTAFGERLSQPRRERIRRELLKCKDGPPSRIGRRAVISLGPGRAPDRLPYGLETRYGELFFIINGRYWKYADSTVIVTVSVSVASSSSVTVKVMVCTPTSRVTVGCSPVAISLPPSLHE